MKKNLPVIALFVYNRPEHTKITIQNLIKNLRSKEYELYVFSDAPKKNHEKSKVKIIRKNIKKIKHFKKLRLIQRQKNLGLYKSIKLGLDYLFVKYEKVIVLEDDIQTNKHFLNYMTKGLEFFNDRKYVGSISGYSFTDKFPKNYKERFYLGYRHSSWGWGTWRKIWKEINWNKNWIKRKSQTKNFSDKFNSGGNDMFHILKEQIKGNINSWSIIFDLNCFLKNKFCLCPKKSLIRNFGFDGSGTHCKKDTNVFDNFDKNFQIKKFKDIKINNKIIKNIKNSFSVSIFHKIKLKLDLI